MSKLDFNIGAQVHCEDGRCGRVRKVVVDPKDRQVTDLIVEKGFLQKTDRVVPVSLVERATEDDVYLAFGSDRLAKLPEYHEEDYVVPAPAYRDEDGGLKRAAVMPITFYDALYPGSIVPPTYVPMIRKRVHEGISPELAVIGRGAPVRNLEGQVGTVDHVLVDPESDEITHLIVNRRPLSHPVIIPASHITEVDDEKVFVDVTRDELGTLPRYVPRAEAEIRAELRERLEQISDELKGITATVEDGVLRLAGVVPDVGSKRKAEAAARCIAGVIDVDDRLDTNTAIVARMINALACDPRTELSAIEVISERGLVTLKGQVDSDEVRQAAGEVASKQPGVVKVINALEVRPDDDTERLKYRPLGVEATAKADATIHRQG